MDILISLLIILNVTLAMAIFVAGMARMDQRYAAQVKKEQQYRAHFRRDPND